MAKAAQPTAPRIIAGKLRGRKLITPRGETTRPTANRTRETLFNMLASRIGAFDELTVADLFAGSGALGLEALSRGVAHCLFVEQDKLAIDAIRANVEAFGLKQLSSIQHVSAMKLGPAKTAHDLLMLDPPYGTGAGIVALDRLLRLGWIGPATWIALECGRDESVEVNGLQIQAERSVGKAKLVLLRLTESEN